MTNSKVRLASFGLWLCCFLPMCPWACDIMSPSELILPSSGDEDRMDAEQLVGEQNKNMHIQGLTSTDGVSAQDGQ